MRVVHVVSQNHKVNGYSLRTRRIVEEQRRQGVDAVIVAPRLEAEGEVGKILDLADQLDVYAWPKADIIHAHSPWWTATAAILAMRRSGSQGRTSARALLYERRGLQHESAIADGRRERDSAWFRRQEAGERLAVEAADGVFAISPMLVPERGAALVPNGVDAETFFPRAPLERFMLREKYNLGDGPVVAYIGSLRPLEGVDEMIRALPRLRELVPGLNSIPSRFASSAVRFLLVGLGENFPQLIQLAQELGVEDMLDYRGPCSPDAVPELLGAVDCVAITRPDTYVTRAVTPIKPLEALACGVPVVMSDLLALRFMGERGALFYEPGNTEDLAAQITRALSPWAWAGPLGLSGRRWVEEERTWTKTVEAHLRLYEEVLR